MEPKPPLQLSHVVNSAKIWATIKRDLSLARVGRHKAQAFELAVLDHLRNFLDEYGESVAVLAGKSPAWLGMRSRKIESPIIGGVGRRKYVPQKRRTRRLGP